jgi:chitin disaccharide deacetylase
MRDHAACTPVSGQHPSIRLVVNADDFGISAPINEGIVLAHRAGIVTAASLMAVGRAFEQAVQSCRAVPALDVGVHLTLVAERPLLACRSSLAGDDGRFPESAGAFLRLWLKGSIRRIDVQAEWSAQIERVLDHGIRVTHLDSHQHVHILPGLADLGLNLAARYNIPFVRVPVEDLRGSRWPSLHGMNRMFGAAALRASWALARLTGAKASTYRPLRFLGFQDGGRLDDLRLRRLLCSLRPGRAYELMCHPGLTPDDPDVKRWHYGHAKELQTLTNPSIRSEIAARGIQLCNFKDLT